MPGPALRRKRVGRRRIASASRQFGRGTSALTNELVVPLLDRPVVDKYVGPAVNVDLQRWRINGRSTNRRPTFAPEQHALTLVHHGSLARRHITTRIGS